MSGFDPVPGLLAAKGHALLVAAVVLPRMAGMQKPVCFLTGPELDDLLGVGSHHTRRKYLAAAEEAMVVVSKPAGPRGIKFFPGPAASVPIDGSYYESTAESDAYRSASESAVDRGRSASESAVDTPPVVVEEDVDVVPPIVPHRNFELSPDVFMVLTEEPFEGFRSALEDYLRDRVKPERQHGYVRTVQSWIQMAHPPLKDLMKLDNWRTMIAAALNKMLTMDPEQEALFYKSAKGQIGSPDSLRNAIRYELTQAHKEMSNGRRNGNGGGSPRGTGRGVDLTISSKTIEDFDLD